MNRRGFSGAALFLAGFLTGLLVLTLLLWAVPAKAASFGDGYTVPAPRERVIEVVDAVKPSRWDVAGAAQWLDRYTASDMRVVKRCSGKAWRCITVKTGAVKGANVGWSSGSTITIDDAKAKRKTYRGCFTGQKRAAVRTWLLAHELAHQFGLHHSARADNLMSPYCNRHGMRLTAAQRAHLKGR